MDHHRNGRIVVGVDGSLPSVAAAEWAAATAASLGAGLTVLRVQPPTRPRPPDMGYGAPGLVSLDDVAPSPPPHDAKLESIADDLRSMQPEVDIEPVEIQDSPGHALLKETESAELVVLGCRGHAGLGRLLGSVADEVVTAARGPVAVIPPGSVLAHGPVIVGADGPPIPESLAFFATHEASRLGVELELVHAVDYHELWGRPAAELNRLEVQDRIEEYAEAITGSIRSHLNLVPDVQATVSVVRGPAAQALVEASQRASEIVVGTRGRGGFRGLLLGSTSREVVQYANCPVIVFPSHLEARPARHH